MDKQWIFITKDTHFPKEDTECFTLTEAQEDFGAIKKGDVTVGTDTWEAKEQDFFSASYKEDDYDTWKTIAFCPVTPPEVPEEYKSKLINMKETNTACSNCQVEGCNGTCPSQK